MISNESFLTTAEAAKRLGVSPGRVRHFLAEGRIQARKFGRDWAIPATVVAEFAKQERRVGNPNFGRRAGQRLRAG